MMMVMVMVMAVMQMQMQTMAVLDILMLSRKVQAPHVSAIIKKR